MRSKASPQETFFQLKPAFSHMPGLILGASDSAHQVFFGRDGNRVVAVKPYKGVGAPERAEHEKDMLEYVRKAGFLTLSPVKVVQTKDGTNAFLLTNYEQNLMTMSAVVQQSSGSVKKLVRRTAETLGDLHSEGISHGDAQIKNFGVMPANGHQIAVIDPEKGGTTKIGHAKNNPFQHDIDSLVQSLAYKAYGGVNTGNAAEIVFRDVIEPYQLHAAAGLGVEMAEQIGYEALTKHIDKHSEIHSPRSPTYR